MDFQKTFDSVDRTFIWNLIQLFEFLPKYIAIIQQLYEMPPATSYLREN